MRRTQAQSAVPGNLIEPQKDASRNAHLVVLAILRALVSMSFSKSFARQPQACISPQVVACLLETAILDFA